MGSGVAMEEGVKGAMDVELTAGGCISEGAKSTTVDKMEAWRPDTAPIAEGTAAEAVLGAVGSGVGLEIDAGAT